MTWVLGRATSQFASPKCSGKNAKMKLFFQRHDYFCLLRGTKGRVIGIDHIAELVEWSHNNVQREGKGDLLKVHEQSKVPTTSVEKSLSSNAWPPLILVEGNGYQGFPAAAPFDAIHVGAAVEVHVPSPLDLIHVFN